MDVLPSLDCSSAVINQQEEEDDEWVVVKKQKITILIPPPSPPSQQIVKERRPKPTKQPQAVKSSSITKEKRRGRSPRTKHKKTASVPVKHKTSHTSEEIFTQLGNKPHVDGSNHPVGKPKLQQLQSSLHAYGVGNVGAVNVVNRQIRAMNLERRLQSLGGMRRWLSLLGLDRFAAVFERKKLGQYQLVNLSTSKLKDMGMNAVGPRRKLMHSIDLLCQPYYSQGF